MCVHVTYIITSYTSHIYIYLHILKHIILLQISSSCWILLSFPSLFWHHQQPVASCLTPGHTYCIFMETFILNTALIKRTWYYNIIICKKIYKTYHTFVDLVLLLEYPVECPSSSEEVIASIIHPRRRFCRFVVSTFLSSLGAVSYSKSRQWVKMISDIYGEHDIRISHITQVSHKHHKKIQLGFSPLLF